MKSPFAKQVTAQADRHLVREVAKRLDAPARRVFLKHSLSLGSLALLTGCNAETPEAVDKMLTRISRFNDRVQWALFNPNALAPTYPDSMITKPFPFNAYYDQDQVREIDGSTWKLELAGLVADKRPWTLTDLAKLPQIAQTTRHICVEGWSAIGKWGGIPFKTFLEKVGADTTAKYVAFKCGDDYSTSIDMPTALHPQTIMTLTFADRTLPPDYGYPMKVRIPTKLGYKNPKHVMAITVTNTYPGGYWEDQGYNWYGGS
ncbi:MAG TPA: molybdopterin-dependent oxidoreductase [Burkholderiales bacterium]|jgi:DMSO/TMAO reductase YedYZ molybdopterin-dependent catalytic subunit